MAKILLINAAVRREAPPNNAPLGPLYIAAYLEAHGHKADICDLNALREIHSHREYWLDMFKANYDVVGMSGLITTYSEQRAILDYILERKADFGDPLIVSGGGLARSAPAFTLRNMSELDAAVVGEGEVTMLDLAEGKSLREIPGVGLHGMTATPRPLIPRLDDLPLPDYSKLPIDVYLKNPVWGGEAKNSSGIAYRAKRSLNMIASRGCTHHCHFCFHDIWGKKYRLRSVENVMAEISELKEKHDIDFIGLVDDNTVADRKWTMDFCQSLIDSELGVHWGCHARVDQIDQEKARMMRASGCEYVGFGVESASPNVLRRMNKKADPQQAADAIRMVRGAGMYVNATFICGYPGETKEDLEMTTQFMRDNDCSNSTFFATAYPGTQLYEESLPKILEKYESEDEYIKDLANATDFRVNLSEMSDEELLVGRGKAMKGGF